MEQVAGGLAGTRGAGNASFSDAQKELQTLRRLVGSINQRLEEMTSQQASQQGQEMTRITKLMKVQAERTTAQQKEMHALRGQVSELTKVLAAVTTAQDSNRSNRGGGAMGDMEA